MEVKDLILAISVIGNILGQCIPIYMKRFDISNQETKDKREKIIGLIEKIVLEVDDVTEQVADHWRLLSMGLPGRSDFSLARSMQLEGLTSLLVAHCAANEIDASDFNIAVLRINSYGPKKYTEESGDIIGDINNAKSELEKEAGVLIKRTYERF